ASTAPRRPSPNSSRRASRGAGASPVSEFLLLAAMPDEAAAIRERSDSVGVTTTGPTAGSELTPITLAGRSGALLTTGIGPVSAAAALTGLCRAGRGAGVTVISVGSAGGLADEVE